MIASELARERQHRLPYTPRDVLVYPFRGQGAYVFWGAVLTFGTLEVIGSVVSNFLLLVLVIAVALVIVLLLAPGLSFAIVRSTSRGSDQLPDWPDLNEQGERVEELLAVLVLGMLAILPAAALVAGTDCVGGVVAAHPGCLLLMGSGLLLGVSVSVPACGATASFGNNWLAVRWDLHLRAFIRTWRESARIALVLSGLYLAGAALAWALSVVPLIGDLLRLTVYVYAWLLGMHLIGLHVRRHETELESIYFE